MRAPGEVVDAEGRSAPRRQRHVQANVDVLTCVEMKGCSFAARFLYTVLTTFLDYRTGDGWASWGDLAEVLGTSRGRVRALGAELEAAGLVERYSRGKTKKGEDFACGWRLVRPASLAEPRHREPPANEPSHVVAIAGAVVATATEADDDEDGEPWIVGGHTYAHPQAGPSPQAGPDRLPDRSPDRSPPKSDLHTRHPEPGGGGAAHELVCAFHRGRGVDEPRPSQTELRFAEGLVREHGVAGAGAIVRYALGLILKSWRDAATFNAVKVYVGRALSAGVVKRAQTDAARATFWESERRKLDRSQDPPEEFLEALKRDVGDDCARGLPVVDRWALVEHCGVLEAYLERRWREVERVQEAPE